MLKYSMNVAGEIVYNELGERIKSLGDLKRKTIQKASKIASSIYLLESKEIKVTKEFTWSKVKNALVETYGIPENSKLSFNPESNTLEVSYKEMSQVSKD